MEEARTIVSGNKVFRPLLDYTVTEEDWTKAEVELNETPETRASALKALKKLLTEQTDFSSSTDDGYLLRFLRVRKFDVDQAFKLMKNRYMVKAKYPEVFASPSSIEKALKANFFNFLPHRDDMGRAIAVCKIDQWNPDEVSYLDFVAVGHLLGEHILDYPATQINGFVGLYDCKGLSIKHFIPLCSPKNIFLIVSLMQDCFPGRLKVAYCVNCPPLMHTGWNIFKLFLKKKLRKRVMMLSSDMNSLHQFLDPSMLPEEFGGKMPTADCKELADLVLKNEQYFDNERQSGCNPR